MVAEFEFDLSEHPTWATIRGFDCPTEHFDVISREWPIRR
jgi:hypothetical protein